MKNCQSIILKGHPRIIKFHQNKKGEVENSY